MLARLARVFVAAALLAGWQAALLHPLQHSGAGGLVHLGGNPAEKSELCDALAALTACAPEGYFSFRSPSPGGDSPLFSKSEWRPAQAPPFLAQGPPALL